MGLMDVIRGMSNGPRGEYRPTPSSGGMSPLTMAALAMLAYKAFKGAGPFGNVQGGGRQSVPGGTPARLPQQQPNSGGLSDLLRGGLGGLLAGGAAGSILSGGLGELVKQLQQNGHGDVARSWVGTGPNEAIQPKDLASVLGADTLDALADHTGISRQQVLDELSEGLPSMVDSLTPHGRIPTQEEFSRML